MKIESISFTKQLSMKEKKKNGIFFTPKTIIDHLLNEIDFKEYKNILEPSCGTGEFVDSIDKKYDNVCIDAVELNPTLFNYMKTITYKNNVNVIHKNYLDFDPTKKYDLVVGNPPYVVCGKGYSHSYDDYMIGRPNLFVLFIIHSLMLLNPNGILAFVVPKSFLNSGYYLKVRRYIIDNCTILNIINYSSRDFVETNQSIMGIVIQNSKATNTSPFILKDNLVLKNLDSVLENATTLKAMKLKVKTGTLVWNQHKDKMTTSEKTFVIYNSNIKDNHIVPMNFSNKDKKQYIEKDGILGRGIVVNRGNGNSTYKFSYALIDYDTPFLVENHLNFIYSDDPDFDFLVVLKSFENPKTTFFLENFIGNNSLSKTELEQHMPIYL